MNQLFEQTTTAASAAKALNVSRRTVNRYLADRRLEDGGLGPDGERRVTLTSLTRLKADLDATRQHVKGHDEEADAGPTGADALVHRTLAMLEEELRARRDEVERTRETLLITERSTAELQADRDRLQVERDTLEAELTAAREQAAKARHAVAAAQSAGPFTRWKARREAMTELANL